MVFVAGAASSGPPSAVHIPNRYPAMRRMNFDSVYVIPQRRCLWHEVSFFGGDGLTGVGGSPSCGLCRSPGFLPLTFGSVAWGLFWGWLTGPFVTPGPDA